jgi:hypothetical protein
MHSSRPPVMYQMPAAVTHHMQGLLWLVTMYVFQYGCPLLVPHLLQVDQQLCWVQQPALLLPLPGHQPCPHCVWYSPGSGCPTGGG